jgi:alkylhydroperoxidase family enzyme
MARPVLDAPPRPRTIDPFHLGICRAVLDYAAEITRDASAVTDAHHERLRAAGFDDRGILQITLIAAWFNYINRVADALGVGRE